MDQHCAKHDKYWLKNEREKGAWCTSAQLGHVNEQVAMIALVSQSYSLQPDTFPRRSWRSVSGACDEFQRTWLRGRARPLERSFVISAWAPCPCLGDTYKGHHRGWFLVINQQGNLGRCVLLVPVPLSCLGLALDSGWEMISYKMERSNKNERLKYVFPWKLREMWSCVLREESFVIYRFNCCECCLCKVFPWKLHVFYTECTKH